jgi:hypothetical protein
VKLVRVVQTKAKNSLLSAASDRRRVMSSQRYSLAAESMDLA